MKKKISKIKINSVKKNIKISLAESCTGGLISSKLTSISGSSDYFDCAIISYSNESKIKLLGVSEKLINKYGAVSKEVSLSMAEKLLKITNSDLCISVTGIAGPDGGSKDKPVGTIFITFIHSIKSQKKIKKTYKKLFKSKTRSLIQKDCTEFVLDKIIDCIN